MLNQTRVGEGEGEVEIGARARAKAKVMFSECPSGAVLYSTLCRVPRGER